MIARVDAERKVAKGGELAHMEPRGPLDRYRYIFFYLITPAYSGVEKRYLLLQTRLDQLRLACALERHRLARGDYPKTLAALVPDYASDLPHDVMDGNPLRYERDSDAGYVLYSVALNRKDDGGKGATEENVVEGPDWVWRPRVAIGDKAALDGA